uniref:Uncharacterized protein n=1 Tax=Cannabis sativa TaxID=3483 RepID=A0A803PCR6_CANSA
MPQSGQGPLVEEENGQPKDNPINNPLDEATASITPEEDNGMRRLKAPSHHRPGKENRAYLVSSRSQARLHTEEMNELRLSNL